MLNKHNRCDTLVAESKTMVLIPQAKPPTRVHHKKRSGKHHKHSKDYSKPYWPYLPLLAIVGIGIIANGVWTQRTTNVLGYATDVSATQLLADTNQQRSANHEAGLQLNSKLSAAAQAKANDMVRRNYWSHNTPDGRAPWTFVTQAGYQYRAAGENLAYGFNDSKTLVSGWMNSTEHRANILNNQYQDVGFGIANAPNFQGSGTETVVVALYGAPTNAAAVAGARTSTTTNLATTLPAAKRVARLQILGTGISSWGVFAVSSIAAIAAVGFVLRHGLLWRRAWARSEAFVMHHPFLDILIIGIATVGFVLTRTAGMIH